jgi:hypothetical protein
MKKISLKEYAEKHNPRLSRRNKRMTESYLYRLIRQAHAGERNDLWFDYIMEGPKDRIYIVLPN